MIKSIVGEGRRNTFILSIARTSDSRPHLDQTFSQSEQSSNEKVFAGSSLHLAGLANS